MNELNRNTLRNIGLQFFAEGGEDRGGGKGSGDDNDSNNPTNNPTNNPDNESTGDKSGKTFTQNDVNRMLKAEKEAAKKALLKELGMEDVKSAKDGLAEYKKILDKDKTDAQKAQESLGAETKAKEEAEKRALLAEAKVEVLSAGCKPDYLEDVITLAMNRVTDDKDLASVVKEMKKDAKYATFFGEEDSGSGDRGTGGGNGYKRTGGGKVGELGSRLGKQASARVKNPYFTN